MDLISPAKIHPSVSKKMTDQVEGIQRKFQTGHSGKTEDELMSVAKDFESILIHKMLESMRKTVPKSGLLDSFSLDMFESMMDQEIANEMAKNKGIGLSAMVYKQLTKLNEEKVELDSAVPAPGQEQKPTINIKEGEERK